MGSTEAKTVADFLIADLVATHNLKRSLVGR